MMTRIATAFGDLFGIATKHAFGVATEHAFGTSTEHIPIVQVRTLLQSMSQHVG
jgi:hypothetical protein